MYTVITIYKPRQIDWTITLQQKDKNPYGGYILYHQLKSIFPEATIRTDRLAPYNQLKGHADSNAVYLLVAPQLNLHKEDVSALWKFLTAGNNVFIAANELGKVLADTLDLNMSDAVKNIFRKDSIRINFSNPLLMTDSGYFFRKFTLNNYFDQIDTARTEILGTLDNRKPNFIRIRVGKGFLYLHSSPLCFSNYFMLFQHNSNYTASALSYLPHTTTKIYWDEYYKIGPEYSGSLLTYFLMHRYLRWAWWIALVAVSFYLLFESKRRQRIIPELDPMTNTSLDFVKTIGNLYFNTRDNKNIAQKKIAYFLEFVRSKLFLSTGKLDERFITALSNKSNVETVYVKAMIDMIIQVENSGEVNDRLLLQLNKQIDNFYKQIK